MIDALAAIDRLKGELDGLRPLEPSALARVAQKLRIDANYHSNAIEGNSLTLGETRSLILHGLTARGKPLRDHLDIEGHDTAVKAIEDVVRDGQELNEVFIRNLHRVLLKEPYETDAITPDERHVKRSISLGDYKTVPNNVITSTGEVYYFVPPERVKQEMGDLIDWYRTKEQEAEHPVIIAATFHYRFVRIHPFDDGNGRLARLLMNMILMKHGYTVAIVRKENRGEYLRNLEQVDQEEDLTKFVAYVANCCEYSVNLHLRAARGESIDDLDDIDREIALFKRSLADLSDEPIMAQQYIDNTLHPFYEYLRSKSDQFEDTFGRVQTRISVHVTTLSGEVENLCEDATSWPDALARPLISEEARSITFTSSTYLTSFQGEQNTHVLIAVRNETSAEYCRWNFTIGSPRFELEYEGRELNELKRNFNETIRAMMRNLGGGTA